MVLEHLTETEKELLALIIEFEGSVFYDKSNNTINIVVQCTDKIMLNKLLEIVKCGHIYPKNDLGYKTGKTSFSKKRFWIWRIKGTARPIMPCNHLALDFYHEIEPYLLTKGMEIVSLLY